MARSRNRSARRSRRRFVRRLLLPLGAAAFYAWRNKKVDENARRHGLA